MCNTSMHLFTHWLPVPKLFFIGQSGGIHTFAKGDSHMTTIYTHSNFIVDFGYKMKK